MTVATTTTTITYAGNGVTTNFTFPFIGAAASDIVVTFVSSTGSSTVLSPSLYTLVFNPVPTGGLWAIGGNVTYPLTGSPIAIGTSLTISRIVPYTQSQSIANQSNFYPQAVEQALDLLCMEVQQTETGVLYSLKTPASDGTPPNTLPSKSARANGTLQFDVNGQPIVTVVPTSTPAPGAFAQPRKVSTTGTATINVLISDSFAGVSIYQSSTPVTTVQLPATEGPYPIFDGSGNAGTSNITVLPPTGKTIDGQSSYVMNTNFQSTTFYYDGTQVLIGGGSQGLGTNISVPGSISAGTTLSAGTSATIGTTLLVGQGITTTVGNISATAGLVQDLKGELRTLPQNVQTSSYGLVLADNGKSLYMSGGGAGQSVTVPSATFSAGMNLVIYNGTGNSITITQGSGVTLSWAGQNSFGSRTLVNTGLATLLFLSGTVCIVSGVGLS